MGKNVLVAQSVALKVKNVSVLEREINIAIFYIIKNHRITQSSSLNLTLVLKQSSGRS